MVKCCSKVLRISVVGKCCEGVLWRNVVEKCFTSVVKECCGKLL